MTTFQDQYKRRHVTICGSTKFKTEIEAKAAELSWLDQIVLKPEVFSHALGMQLTEEQELFLDTLHKCKIVESDAIHVVNIGGYIGKSTRSEIEFARQRHIPVFFAEPEDDEVPERAVKAV